MPLTKPTILLGFESTVIRADGERRPPEAGVPAVVGTAAAIDGASCRGARAMLGLSQGDLCRLSGLGRNLVNDFETGTRVPRSGNVDKLRAELERAGAEFIALDDGTVAVRIRPRQD